MKTAVLTERATGKQITLENVIRVYAENAKLFIRCKEQFGSDVNYSINTCKYDFEIVY